MKEKLRIIKPGDVVIVLLVILLAAGVAAGFYGGSEGALYAEISVDQELVHRVRLYDGLEDTYTVETGAGYNVIVFSGRQARISHADCNDQVCVQTGWLSRRNQAAVCLPNRVILRITGDALPDDVDAVVQ